MVKILAIQFVSTFTATAAVAAARPLAFEFGVDLGNLGHDIDHERVTSRFT